jgi:hypothetical protein
MTNAHALLGKHGYSVAFRLGAWVECLVLRAGERWVGRGRDQEEAVGDALEQMLPSGLGRALALAEALRLAGGLVASASEVEAAPAPTALASTPEPTPPASVEPAIAPPAAAISPLPDPTLPAAGPARQAPPARRPDESERRGPPARLLAAALAELDEIGRDIEAQLGRVACLTPERQRLSLLAFACRVRAVEEFTPEREVERSAARLVRRLAEIAKLFWPGAIRPLSLSAVPADVLREVTGAGPAPVTWRDAAALTARALTAPHAESLDEDGWADAAALLPRATAPNRLLGEAVAAIAAVLDAGPSAAIAEAEIAQLVGAACTLRWVRGQVADDVAWGTAVGRLRRALFEMDRRRAPELREALDPRCRPRVSWATLCGGTNAGKDGEPCAALAAELPAAATAKSKLLAWLTRAAGETDTPALVAMLEPHGAAVAELDLGASEHPDRRIRRRLRDVGAEIARLAKPAEPSPSPSPVASPASGAAPPDALDMIAAEARKRTQGSRALFVANRDEPDLRARLDQALGITVTWCEGRTRRVEAACRRIALGHYALVLCTTELEDHPCDGKLSGAARAAGIQFLRVHRGRPAACIKAIARSLGIAGAAEEASP